MSRARMDDVVLDNQLLRGKLFKEFMSLTLAGTYVVTNEHPSLMIFDPGGAGRNVDLPLADNAVNRGRIYWIVNIADAAESLTVRHNGGATIATVAQGKIGIFMQVGTAGAPQTAGWYGTPLP